MKSFQLVTILCAFVLSVLIVKGEKINPKFDKGATSKDLLEVEGDGTDVQETKAKNVPELSRRLVERLPGFGDAAREAGENLGKNFVKTSEDMGSAVADKWTGFGEIAKAMANGAKAVATSLTDSIGNGKKTVIESNGQMFSAASNGMGNFLGDATKLFHNLFGAKAAGKGDQ